MATGNPGGIFDDVDIPWRGAGDAKGPHVVGNRPAEAARFPVYAGGYREARGVRFGECHAGIQGVERRDSVVPQDAELAGACAREPRP